MPAVPIRQRSLPPTRLPPAQRGRPVARATAPCPAKALTPCDVFALAVSTQYGKTATRTLATSRRRRGEAVPRGTAADVVFWLREYDLLIDTIASPDASGTAATVCAVMDWRGRCAVGKHGLLSMRVVQGPEPSVATHANKIGPTQIHAIQTAADRLGGGAGLFGFWAFITALMPLKNPKLLGIRAEGCGKRTPGAGSPLGYLNVVVRVVRSGKWKLELTVPGALEFSRTKGSLPPGGKASPPEQAREWSWADYKKRVSAGFKLKLSRNGVEIQGASKLAKVLDYIIQFRENLKAILSVWEKCPQFGWHFEGKFNVLVGELNVEWEPALVSAPEVNGRYLPVRTQFGIEANLKVVEISLELSFGLLARNDKLNSQVEARVVGTFTFTAGLKGNVKFGATSGISLPVYATGELEASARANATVAGAKIIDGNVKITAAVTAEGGMVRIDGSGVHTSGTVKTEPVKLKAEVQFGLLPKWKTEIELLKEREILKW